MLPLEGRVADFTGAGSGLGRAAAVALAAVGADPLLSDLRVEGPPESVAGVEAEGRRAIRHLGDVSSRDGAQAMIELAVRELGGVDALEANAAVSSCRNLETMSELDLDVVADVNPKGPRGIRVNAVASGTIDTPMLQRDPAVMDRQEAEDSSVAWSTANALGRVGRPQEIGDGSSSCPRTPPPPRRARDG